MSRAAMAQFLISENVRCGNLRTSLIENAERVKKHAQPSLPTYLRHLHPLELQ